MFTEPLQTNCCTGSTVMSQLLQELFFFTCHRQLCPAPTHSECCCKNCFPSITTSLYRSLDFVLSCQTRHLPSISTYLPLHLRPRCQPPQVTFYYFKHTSIVLYMLEQKKTLHKLHKVTSLPVFKLFFTPMPTKTKKSMTRIKQSNLQPIMLTQY